MLIWIEKNVYVALGILVLLAILAGTAGFASHEATEVGKLSEEVKTLTHDRDQALLDYSTLQGSYSTLDKAHTMCINEIRVATAAQAEAVATLNQVAQTMQQETADARALHDQIFKAPGCKELAEIDIAQQCPALATSLRQRAAVVSAPKDD